MCWDDCVLLLRKRYVYVLAPSRLRDANATTHDPHNALCQSLIILYVLICNLHGKPRRAPWHYTSPPRLSGGIPAIGRRHSPPPPPPPPPPLPLLLLLLQS